MKVGSLFALMAVALSAADPPDKMAVMESFTPQGHACKSFACKKDPSGLCRCFCRHCKRARGQHA